MNLIFATSKVHLLLLEDELLQSIGETWNYFYAEILPTIQFVLQGITVRLFATLNKLISVLETN